MTTLLSSTGGSQDSAATSGAFVVKFFLFVISLLEFVNNSIKTLYVFTTTIILLLHTICLSLKITILIAGSDRYKLAHFGPWEGF